MTDIQSLSKREREALNHAVSALYFNERRKYGVALWEIVSELIGAEDSWNVEIDVLYRQLNP